MMEKIIGFIHSKKVILMVFVLIAIIFAIPSMKYLSEMEQYVTLMNILNFV